MGGVFAKIRSFIRETSEEMSKCTWPSKQKVLESTVLVIFALVITSLFVFGVDWILRCAVQFVVTTKF